MASSQNSLTKTQPLSNESVMNGDCLTVLSEQNADIFDLVYVDPPFFTQKHHCLKTKDRSKEFSFSDVWKSHREYGDFLSRRIEQCHRVLKVSGSLFFHCDRSAVHIARMILDEIFGANNFRAEIIWMYRRWSNSRRGLLPSHQNILYYSKSSEFTFNTLYTEYSPSTNVDQILQQRERDSDGKSVYKRDENGNVVTNGSKRGVPLGDVWDIPYLNPKAKERVGYPTQKPILLLERILAISTNVDDFVLDPFCGSGTSLVAAKLNGRKFAGIDESPEACELARNRLARPVKSNSALLDSGRNSYRNANQDALRYLHGLSHKPVQRNRGIDALLDDPINGRPVLVRVQRDDETLRECSVRLENASQGKNAGKLIVIKTHEEQTLNLFTDIPATVTICEATAHAVLACLREDRTKA